MSEDDLVLPNGIDEEDVLDPNDEDFSNKLRFTLSTVGSSSDYRNDRARPYNGQAHTDEGIRGKQEIHGLTMRDLQDCFVMGCLACCGVDQPELYAKLKDGTWRTSDVWKINSGNLDLMAVAQNMSCEVERMMGIFPNIVRPVKEES